LLGLVVLAVLGAGLEKLILAIGIVLAPPFARVVHAATLSLKAREFVEAARCMGADQSRIVVRHIVPSLVDETVVLLSAPWLSVFPGLAILISVLAFNLVGDGLRDVLDPSTQS
jgi:peptide/nickel transport system permease protein